MRFHFFTLGGKQFWEDVFCYQNWRIQRHYRTHVYRLLDHWDICHASGSFEDCRQAFVKLIEIYEIPRQKGKLVVLLHGFSESKDIFKSLCGALEKENYNVADINYPSLKKTIKEHVDQLNFFLTHIEDVSEVSFITNGTGCILLRHLFKNNSSLSDKISIGKIINVNPTNLGSEWCTAFSSFKLINWFIGQSLKPYTVVNVKRAPKLPTGIPLGLIFCETYLGKLIKLLTKRYEGIKVPGDLTEEDFSSENIHIKNSRFNIFNNTLLIKECVHFLNEGHFEKT